MTWQDVLSRLLEMQRRIRAAVHARMLSQAHEVLSRTVRDERGDTIFAIDVAAEEIVLPYLEEWAEQTPLVVVAEGLEPESGLRLGAGAPRLRVLLDPIDGTRGLMYDKRSAWTLAAAAPDRGPATSLRDVMCAAMTELPTSRAGHADTLWAVRGGGARGLRTDLRTGETNPVRVAPSRAADLLHGFATVVNFFQGGKELTARIEEEILRRERGGWNPTKAEIYTDQYICTGGQFAELALGRDRFVLDVRPLVHRALGFRSTLCARPYDLCTVLVALEAGCVVASPDGGVLDAPLDVTTNVSFAAYANRDLARRLIPIVRDVLREHGLLGAADGDR